MTVGNAVTKGAKQSLQENLVNRMTGHLILVNAQEETQSLFFTGSAISLKLIPNYPTIKQVLKEQVIVDHVVPMNRGAAMLLNEDGAPLSMEEVDDDSGTTLFGVEFEDYQQMFQHNVTAVEGSLLKNGERGILLSEKQRQKIYEQQHIWVIPQRAPLIEEHLPPEALAAKDRLRVTDNLVLMGLSGESLESDIRVPVKGIVRLNNLNGIWRHSFIDIESFRQCFGYLTAEHTLAALPDEHSTLLTNTDEEELFASDDQVEAMGVEAERYDVAAMQQQTQRSDHPLDTDKGAYQFVVVKLKRGVSQTEGAEQLRQVLAEAQVSVKILTWQQAAAGVTQFAALTQGILVVFVLFIFFVAAIVMMNTLSMAAIERTSEIGMMRAIGARKGFVSKMFLAEITLLSAIFGGFGMISGLCVVWGLVALQIPTSAHDMLITFAGGDTLHPVADMAGFLFGSVQLAVVTLLAALYPIRVARSIPPLEAIARD